MKIIKLLTFFLFITISLEANYCIQVSTSNSSERTSILNEAKSIKYVSFDAVRVESRGRYLVLRIGDYSRYRDAISDAKEIKRLNRDAYIRKCDFIKEEAIYIRDKNTYEINPYYQPKQPEQPKFESQRHIQKREPQITQKKLYKKKEELKYTTNTDSLWDDCKKCFVPIYEEESEIEYEILKEKPTQKRPREASNEIKVKVPKRRPTQESFWSEDIIVEESIPKVSPKSKTRNKFNIDEQFLP